MSDEQLSPEERQALARLVAQSLAKGEKPADISQQLANNGWEKAEAAEFVGRIALQQASVNRPTPQPSGGGGGGGMGWLAWIGVILFINLLSYLFNWPFWIY